jgi:hypothetical protein
MLCLANCQVRHRFHHLLTNRRVQCRCWEVGLNSYFYRRTPICGEAHFSAARARSKLLFSIPAELLGSILAGYRARSALVRLSYRGCRPSCLPLCRRGCRFCWPPASKSPKSLSSPTAKVWSGLAEGAATTKFQFMIVKFRKTKEPRHQRQGPRTVTLLLSSRAKVRRRGPAGSLVGNDVEGDFLAFLQVAQS